MNHINTFRLKPALQALTIGLGILTAQGLWAQTVKLHGAATPKALIEVRLAEITSKSGATLELLGNGTDKGVMDLVDGQADIALISADLAEVARKLNDKKAGSVDVKQLKAVPLGFATFVLIVNPQNPVRKLTNQQAADVLSGKIKNWKEVGGLDQTIVLISLPEANGARAAFQGQLLKSQHIAGDAHLANSTVEVRSIVATSPRAIGMVGSSTVSDKVVALTLDSEVQSPMSLVVKGDAAGAVKRVMDATVAAIR